MVKNLGLNYYEIQYFITINNIVFYCNKDFFYSLRDVLLQENVLLQLL